MIGRCVVFPPLPAVASDQQYAIIYADPPSDHKGQLQHAGPGNGDPGGAAQHDPTTPVAHRTAAIRLRLNPTKSDQHRTRPNKPELPNLDYPREFRAISSEIAPRTTQIWTNLDKSGLFRTPERPIPSPPRQIVANRPEFAADAEFAS